MTYDQQADRNRFVDAVVAGAVLLEFEAEEAEELAEETEPLDWPPRRRLYHTAGRHRLKARALRRALRNGVAL